MTLVDISSWQVYIGIILNAICTGIGVSIGSMIANHKYLDTTKKITVGISKMTNGNSKDKLEPPEWK